MSREQPRKIEGVEYSFQGRAMIPREEEGKLWWIGENPASDAVITREIDGQVQVLLVKRKNNGKWGFPGGMIEKELFKNSDGGEVATVNLELDQEAHFTDGDGHLVFRANEKLHPGRLPVKDDRNDDISNITTSVFYRHYTGEAAKKLNFRLSTDEEKKLPGQDEIDEIAWVNIIAVPLNELHANHGEILESVIHEKKLMPILKSS